MSVPHAFIVLSILLLGCTSTSVPTPCATDSTIPGTCAYNEAYYYHIQSATNFPPIDTSSDVLDVGMNVVLRGITDISPGSGSWTGRFQIDMYWPNAVCSSNAATTAACAARVGTFYFMSPVGTTSVTSHANSYQNLWTGLLPNDYPRSDYNDVSFTVKSAFDAKNYPFEAHELKLTLHSWYSLNTVNMTLWDGGEQWLNHEQDVPAGWTLHGFTCTTSVDPSTSPNRGENLMYSNLVCYISVSKYVYGYFGTDFVSFWICILFLYIHKLCFISDAAHASNDSKDQVKKHIVSTCSSYMATIPGVLLVYIWRVPISPYGQTLEVWPSMPASTIVHIIGLCYMFLMGAWVGTLSFVARMYLSNGWYGPSLLKAYDMSNTALVGNEKQDLLASPEPLFSDKLQGETTINLPSTSPNNPDESPQAEEHHEPFRKEMMEFMKEQFRSGTKYGRDDDYTKGIAGEDGALFKSFSNQYVVQTKTLARLLNQLNMCDFVIRTCLLVVCACSAVGILLAARADAEDRISTGKSWN